MRHELLAASVGATMALVAGLEGDAKACGGCFHTPDQIGTVVTDHRMIFAVSQQQTTLYDQIEYQGSPSNFAWVLPIHGPVTVGLSADSLFSVLDANTQTTIVPPQLPACPFCACGGPLGATAGAASGSSSSGGSSGGGVSIISQAVVGPYATVQLQSTDPNALNAWLTANGYVIPANVMPIIAAYVNEGFDFLALRLTPGQGVSAMRPVSVTSAGAGLTLPLRMVAAGTGATVGLTLWVVGEGRYEPKNFLTFLISPSDLTWDFSTSESDYTTVRQQKETSLKNTAWQIESSLDISPFTIENAVLNGGFGGGVSGSSSGSGDSSSSDYAAIPAVGSTSDGGPGSPGETADQVRQQDLATLFAGGPATTRITRMRADLSQAALATDLVLQAASDQSALPNTYQVTKFVNAPMCAPIDPSTCPCGISSGSSGSGSAGASGAGSSGGTGGSSGVTSAPSKSPQDSSGCSMGPAGDAGSDLEIAFAGLLGVALLRTLKKRR
jgi:Uncharacterized protein conserved in bacteria (DUF2330)